MMELAAQAALDAMSERQKSLYYWWLSERWVSTRIMPSILDIDWPKLFVPSSSLAEIFVRGTVIYPALVLAMRLLPRRAIGPATQVGRLLEGDGHTRVIVKGGTPLKARGHP